jgi:hypothetical protein
LQDEILLISGANDPGFVEAKCNENNFNPVFSLITDEYEIIGPMVERKLGIAFISTLDLYDMKKSLSFQRLSKICILPIGNNTFQRTLGILQRKHHYFSSAAKGFNKQLITYFKNIEMEDESM